MLKGIQNIIFDLGGVILDIDFTLTIQAFEHLQIKSSDFFSVNQPHFLTQLETGEISPEEFYDAVRDFSKKNISNNKIRDAWNALLLTTPKERIDAIKRLKNNFQIYLLSNTNQIHQDYFTEYYRKNHQVLFEELFHKDYYSHQMGLRKPNLQIFDTVIKNHNLFPGETLFIDDSLANIEGAHNAGLKTWHLTPGESITTLTNTLK